MVRIVALALIIIVSLGFSLSPSEERQLLKDVAEIKATLKTFMEQTNKRFEELRQDMNERFRQVDKRFEQVDKRISELREDMNERFGQVDKRFEQLYTFLWIITGIFTTLTATVIAFAWWDRRTIIRKAKEETFEDMEREIRPEKFKKLLNALRERANTDKELAKILKQFGLL